MLLLTIIHLLLISGSLGDFIISPWGVVLFFILSVIAGKSEGNPSIGPIFLTKSSKVENSKDLEDINVSKDISSLTITRLAFWNDGTETILSESIAKKDPLRIEVDPRYRLYDYKIIYAEDVNDVKLEKQSDNIISVSFDYLAYNHGFVVELYHSASSSLFINVKGSFKSGVKIKRGHSVSSDYVSSNYVGTVPVSKYQKARMWVLLAISFSLFLFYSYFRWNDIENLPTGFVIFLLVFSVIYILMLLFIIYIYTRSFLPLKLSRFFNDE